MTSGAPMECMVRLDRHTGRFEEATPDRIAAAAHAAELARLEHERRGVEELSRRLPGLRAQLDEFQKARGK
jgi:hypothetical protein